MHHTWRRATAIFPSNASGTIVASGTPGNFVMHITKCYTGERQQFFGVNFFDEDQPRTGGHLVIPIDEDPYISLNNLNSGGSQIYRSTSCQSWDAELHHGWRSYARMRNMVGHVRFDCQFHDPETHVTGDLTFRSCQ